jgi:hypothetical protein
MLYNRGLLSMTCTPILLDLSSVLLVHATEICGECRIFLTAVKCSWAGRLGWKPMQQPLLPDDRDRRPRRCLRCENTFDSEWSGELQGSNARRTADVCGSKDQGGSTPVHGSSPTAGGPLLASGNGTMRWRHSRSAGRCRSLRPRFRCLRGPQRRLGTCMSRTPADA